MSTKVTIGGQHEDIDLDPKVPPAADPDSPQIHLFVDKEYLLVVDHDEAEWMNEARPKAVAFFHLLRQSGCVGLPEKNTSKAPEVQIKNSDDTFTTLFPVRWDDSKSVGERLGEIRNFLQQNSNPLKVLDKSKRIGTLVNVIPNWYVGASGHNLVGTHGPAKPPRPASTTNGTGKVVKSAPITEIQQPASVASEISQSNQTSQSIPIDIYILDTVPPAKRITSAWKKWGGKGSPNFSHTFSDRYEEILKGELDEKGIYITEKAQYHYAKNRIFGSGHSPVLGDPEAELKQVCHPVEDVGNDKSHERYEASDHGLFIAGLIHRLDPDANLFVIQVLNKYGVGTFLSLAAGFQKVAELRATRHNHAIVNCSFTYSLPTIKQMGMRRVECEKAMYLNWEIVIAFLKDWLNMVKESKVLLAKIVGSVAVEKDGKKAVIVACAGNDSAENGKVETRSPASMSAAKEYSAFVVAVGALREEAGAMKVASYSNKIPPNGLLAFGGHYSDKKDDSTEGGGIVSIYSSTRINKKLNTTGLAEWSGTSFATPIVTSRIATLCRLWNDPEAALNALRSNAATSQPQGRIPFELVSLSDNI